MRGPRLETLALVLRWRRRYADAGWGKIDHIVQIEQYYCAMRAGNPFFDKTKLGASAKYVNMADVFSSMPAAHAAPQPGPEATLDLVALVELIFFAYRDWTAGPDQILAVYGLGRAHHRVLHFVNQRPGLRVSDLLDVLKITKQSLNRVLKPLYSDGWLEARAGVEDRRERNLFLTEKGKALAERLLAMQTARLKDILADAELNPQTLAHGTAGRAVAFLMAMRSAAPSQPLSSDHRSD